MRVMRLVVFVLTPIVLTLWAQAPKYDDPKPIPADRVVDTYNLYEATLARPVWGHNARGSTYYIVDRAMNPRGWHSEKCMHPPDELRGKMQEMLEDMDAQPDAYALERRLNLDR